ncbi:MAG: hypothetical protein ACYCZR_00935 [Burkholderiales bacterium]
MAVTDVQICNMALGHLGHTKFIATLAERSLAANLCDLYYEPARDFALEDFPWPFATKYLTLGLVEDFTDDTNPHDWNYSYRYPDDCVFARRLVTSLGRTNPTPPPFKVGADAQGRLIYTDEADAVLEYTKLVTDTNLFPSVFAVATSWYLASLIAPGLAKDRKQAMGALQVYEVLKSQAQAQQLNEQQQSVEPESEFIRART